MFPCAYGRYSCVLTSASVFVISTSVHSSSTSGPQPTILMCHGGPHSAVVSGYYSSLPFMLELGYTIVTVNFRGSLGYGERHLQSLPGNIGTYDVADCIAALDYCIEKGVALSVSDSIIDSALKSTEPSFENVMHFKVAS